MIHTESPDGSIVRYLVAPAEAEKNKDTLEKLQKAQQKKAGAMPPEVYGHDLFELLRGNVVRLRDGLRIPFRDDDGLRAILSRFLDSTSFDGMQLARLVEQIHEGQNASRKAASRSY